MRIDALQYVRPSENVFRQMRAGGLDAVHITVGYHEDFAGVARNLGDWSQWFEAHPDLIVPARSMADVAKAQTAGQTAIFFGTQNPLPLGADLRQVAVCHDLGLRFMQLTYNQQSLLGAGCFETHDSGLTDFGRHVVRQMNRLGMVIDLSHAGFDTMADIIAASTRPVALTHGNPGWWHKSPRNPPDEILRALTRAGGMLGLSLYPHHLLDGSACSLTQFCEMTAEAASRYGVGHIGIGSDLCQGQPDHVVGWMRDGDWRPAQNAGAVFPDQPVWFVDNRDWDLIADGLAAQGFSGTEVAGILGDNWARYLEQALLPDATVQAKEVMG